MNYVLGMLIIVLSAGSVHAGYGPCAHQLLATGDRVKDTEQFTMYLELLLDNRILSLRDLDHFQKALESNEIMNPVLNKDSNKQIAYSHKQFEILIQSQSLDLSEIRGWLKKYIEKSSVVEKQKQDTNKETVDLPVHVAKDGAMFFKFTHPVLGKAIKILKPGGNAKRYEDWDERVWAIEPLKNKKGAAIEYSNVLSKKSAAVQACKRLGKEIELPSKEDYERLMKYFEHELDEGYIRVSEKGFKDFEDLFNQSGKTFRFWTSTPAPEEERITVDDQFESDDFNRHKFKIIQYAWMFRQGRTLRLRDVDVESKYSVRCVGKLDRNSFSDKVGL